MYARIVTIGISVLLGACSYVSEYEKAVYDLEPTYCYKSIGKVACYKEPFHRDEKRLVNYYGPAPSRFDRPEPPAPAVHHAPPAVDFYVRDREPIPEPAAPRETTRLPWLKSAAMAPVADPSPRVIAPISPPPPASVVEIPSEPFEQD